MTARKSLLLFITNITNSLLGLASAFVVARFLGPGPMGTVAYLLGLAALWASFSDLGLGLGLSVVHRKCASEHDDYGDCVGAYALIKSTFTGVLITGVWLIPLLSRTILGQEVLSSSDQLWSYCLLSGTYVFNNLAAISLLTFEARRETARVSTALIISSFVTAVAKIVVALLRLNVVALSGAFLAESLTLFIVAWSLFPGHPLRRPSRSLLTRYITYAVPLAGVTILSALLGNLPKVTLQWFWNETELGYYVGILGIIGVLEKVPTAAMKLFFPRICQDVTLGDWNAVRKRLGLAERYLLMVMVPVTIGVIAFRHPIIHTLLGSEFMPATGALTVLTFNSLLRTYFRPYGNLIYAIEQQSKEIFAAAASFVVLIIATPILVPQHLFGVPMAGLGKTGTAIVIVAMQLVGGVIEVAVCSRHAGVGPYTRFVRHIPAGLAMGLMLWLGERFTGPLNMWDAFVFGPLSIAAYIGALALVGEFNRADVALFLDLVNPRKMLRYVVTELRKSETA